MRKRVAIIGSGFGGLSTAIRLQAAGIDVTIFEKRDKPGGRAYVYEDNGFTFDAGPTVITAPHCLEELFEVSGRSMDAYVKLLPVSPLYRLCWDDGFRFEYTNDLDETIRQIRQFAPEDEAGYRKFLEYTREVFDEGYTKLAHVPFLDFRSMLRVAPQLVRLQAFRSVYSMVSKYVKNRYLREAFSFHSLLVGGDPFQTSSIYTLIHFLERKWGVYFAQGGTGALIRGLVRLFQELGGTIRTNVEIEEIATSDGRVVGVLPRGGSLERFDAVVSNADVYRTYRDLLKREARLDRTRRRLARQHYSMSLFLIYFGTRRLYPDQAHHSVLFGPRYRGLLGDIFKNGKLSEDFSLYLHAPTRTDPTVAPEGCENFYVLSPVPHLGLLPIDWKEEGPRYADRILRYLERKYLPDLRRNIIVQRIFTPKDFETELNAHFGSAFSIDPRLTQSAYFRVHNRDGHVRGLYFAGAGTHPGAGIPGTVNSGKATATLLLQDLTEPQLVGSARATERVAGPVAALEGPPVAPATLGARCRDAIRDGSKSFAMAAKLFAPETREASFALYAFCRHCDDTVDRSLSPDELRQRVEGLERSVRATFRGEPPPNVAFQALGVYARRHRIPEEYALELVRGMAMDAEGRRYRTLDELLLYCHRVAGVVGLMLSHAMGVTSDRALRHAADLGLAMQLTNIARDVVEDARLGRVYLPEEWLEAAGLVPEDVGDRAHALRVHGVVQRLLDEADARYRSGQQGLKYLPVRSALAVATALRVYRAIGERVRADGARAWDCRARTSRWRKLVAVFEGMGLVLGTVPARLIHRQPARAPQTLWRPA
jgi:phytoene desaturase